MSLVWTGPDLNNGGPRLFDHTDWKSKKRSARPQMSCLC